MKKSRQLRIWPVVRRSWSSALAAICRMPIRSALTLAVLLFLAYLKFRFLDLMLNQSGIVGFDLGTIMAGSLGFAALTGVAVAPLQISVCRYVLLNETTGKHWFNINFVVLIRFAIGVGVFMVLLRLPNFAPFLILTAQFGLDGAIYPVKLLIVAVPWIGAAAIFFAAMSMFPAIAVGAPNAGLGNALADSLPHLGRISLVGVLCSLPVIVLQGFAQLTTRAVPDAAGAMLSQFLVDAFLDLAWLSCITVAASYVYACHSDRQGRVESLRVN